jgi:hypothetical protein
LALLLLPATVLLLSTNVTLSAVVSPNSIGSVSAFTGTSAVVRKDQKLSTQSRLPIQQMDNVQTGNGRVEITFVDNSNVKVTEHSKLVIDDFVFSGNPNTSKMALNFASGTIRFTTGQLGKINKQNIVLNTPSATIAVRGTDFATTVDDFGKSLVILLPEEDGTVGEITVSNAGGSVTLTKAFQATMVRTFDNAPSKPAILNLTLDQIDNMLIISPANEIADLGETTNSKANILDLSELDIDYLKNTELEKDDLQLSSLDVDPLNANFLEDYLASSMGGSSSKDGVTVNGTGFGYDPTTQIYTIIAGDKVQFTRSVGTTVVVNVEKDKGKVLNINAGGKEYSVQVNEGGTNINLKQSN